MLKRLYDKAQSIWRPHKDPLIMSHNNKNVISGSYLDPKKITKILNEMLGEHGWSKMEASFEIARRPHLKDARANVYTSPSRKQSLSTLRIRSARYA